MLQCDMQKGLQLCVLLGVVLSVGLINLAVHARTDAARTHIEPCHAGDSGYLDAYFVDDTRKHVYTTLHRAYPAREENMVCIISNHQRITIEPDERPL